jgi:hypothetical protein
VPCSCAGDPLEQRPWEEEEAPSEEEGLKRSYIGKSLPGAHEGEKGVAALLRAPSDGSRSATTGEGVALTTRDGEAVAIEQKVPPVEGREAVPEGRPDAAAISPLTVMGWADLVESEAGEGRFDCEEHGAGGSGGNRGSGARIWQWSAQDSHIQRCLGPGRGVKVRKEEVCRWAKEARVRS